MDYNEIWLTQGGNDNPFGLRIGKQASLKFILIYCINRFGHQASRHYSRLHIFFICHRSSLAKKLLQTVWCACGRQLFPVVPSTATGGSDLFSAVSCRKQKILPESLPIWVEMSAQVPQKDPPWVQNPPDIDPKDHWSHSNCTLGLGSWPSSGCSLFA